MNYHFPATLNNAHSSKTGRETEYFSLINKRIIAILFSDNKAVLTDGENCQQAKVPNNISIFQLPGKTESR